MIQANELRIGNWVHYNNGHYCEITAIGSRTILGQQFFNIDKGNDHPIIDEHINPIPITPEILENAGFKINEDAGNWKHSEMKIWKDKRKMIGEEDGKFYLYNQCEDDYYSWYYPEIKYVHQLQNLYFALTGEELEFKL